MAANSEAALSPVSALGGISQVDEQIIYNELQALLTQQYQLIPKSLFEKAQEQMFEELEREECTEEHCIRRIQDILQVERLFTLMILKSGDMTQLSLTLITDEKKIVETGSCDNCTISGLVAKIKEVTARVVAKDSGVRSTAPNTVQRIAPQTVEQGTGDIQFVQPKISGDTTAGFAAITLESEPSEAIVYLGDTEAGRTPFYDDTLAPDQQLNITLRKQYYHDKQLQLRLSPGINDLGIFKLNPNFGALRVTSEPTGADVLLGGIKVGKTPYINKKLMSKAYMLDMKLEKYAPEKHRIEIEDQKQTIKHIKLQPNFGTLSVSIEPKGATIILFDEDGKEFAKRQSPVEIRLEPGRYRFQLDKAGYRSMSGNLSIVRGEQQQITSQQVKLVRKEGRLVISSNPFKKGADIYINGSKSAYSIPASIVLSEGSYDIEIKTGEFSGRQRIDSVDGKTARVKIQLQKEQQYKTAKTHQLTILHTNDHHGHFSKFNPYPVSDVGGLSAQATLVNIVKAEISKTGGKVLVLSAGDINTGIPESDMQDAEPDIIAMNMIGYDAMVLGNHEFDKSRNVLMKQKDRAEFPFLSANIFLRGTRKTLVEPYIIKNLDGLRVAILGLTTEQTPILTRPDNVEDLEFKDPINIAKRLVPILRKKADLVIALTHLGLYEDNDQKGDIALAKAVPELDVIVGGHTHTRLEKPVVVGKTIIVQAGGYSEYVGKLNLKIDTSDGDIAQDFELLPVNMKRRVKNNGKKFYYLVGRGYVEDREVLKAMEPYLTKANSLLSQPIGRTIVALSGGKTDSRTRETNLGNLITDAIRAKTGADIGFQNGGGIRAGIAPGTISYRDILTVNPFGNTLVLIDMTGSQVKEVLNYSAGKIGSGAFMQVSGLKFTIKNGRALNIRVGNVSMIDRKIYTVATNNFVGAGGDGYRMLKPLAKEDTGFVDADVVKEYIERMKTVSPRVEGRIRIVQ